MPSVFITGSLSRTAFLATIEARMDALAQELMLSLGDDVKKLVLQTKM